MPDRRCPAARARFVAASFVIALALGAPAFGQGGPGAAGADDGIELPPFAVQVGPGRAALLSIGQYRAMARRDGLHLRMKPVGESDPVHLSYRLVRVRAGASVLFERGPAHAVLPDVEDHARVVYRHCSGIDEVYEAQRYGVEQLVKIRDPLPAGADLCIEGAYETALDATGVEGRGVAFMEMQAEGPQEVLWYGEPTIIDAVGRHVRGRSCLQDGRIAVVFAAGSLDGLTYPITVDPLIGDDSVLATSSGDWLNNVSLAWNENSNQFLAVWDRSGNIYGQRLSGVGALVGSQITIDSSSGSQTAPFVAHSPDTNRYCVVYEHTSDDVRMATVSSSGSVLGTSTIDHASLGIARQPAIAYQ